MDSKKSVDSKNSQAPAYAPPSYAPPSHPPPTKAVAHRPHTNQVIEAARLRAKDEVRNPFESHLNDDPGMRTR